ncbi:tricarballylate dehydrogenase [Trichophyton equinum CBS 127.97]|uniref:Tricarballylate dehydrogenase n=1 Tax=Trichophyton equinum (strain ATCC MYA-4606 / CBS 127.97) TaxID=559882 RepID=F2Q5W6_TRIEC|nr:tricarballylate dehydrogenase [Trichophyton equinum CBS 127.97]
MAIPQECDVLVVGSGNAGFSAAISAAENGARDVVLIEKAPEEWAGGNTYFTAGAFRTVHNGLGDVLPIMNQALCKALVQDSNITIKWLASLGVRFQLSFNRQSYKVDGRYRFWGGMSLKTEDGGKGLIQDYQAAARRMGVSVFYSTPLMRLVSDPATGTLSGAVVENNGSRTTIKTQAVILAAGGFESNPQMRAQYLGDGWDKAFVRGTPYNVGDCLEIAIRDMSAKKAGDWSGCHSVAWDASAPKSAGPYLAVKVTCGITFTFGGLAVTPETATVISSANNEQIPGLYCVGEMLGGLFHGNYPGGSGLTSGAVFGRRAGSAAARRAQAPSSWYSSTSV